MARQSKTPEVRSALATPGTQADIVQRTGLTQIVVSYILRKMEACRDVRVNRERRPHFYALIAGPTAAPVDVAAGDVVDDEDAADLAHDLKKSRAWLKDWKPSRDPLVAAMFGPGANPTGKRRASR